MNKIFECEICLEKFPIDCFEFMPCMHKMCSFCFNSLSKTECPFCKTSIINLKQNNRNHIDLNSHIETLEDETLEREIEKIRENQYDKDYNKSYNFINENKNKKRNKNKK